MILLALACGACGFVATAIDDRANRVAGARHTTPPNADDAAFHARLFIADLHADTLLWERNLMARAGHGHVDLPRLRDGNVSLQVFTVVTKTPLPTELPDAGYCVDPTGLAPNGLLSAIQLRPINTWFDMRQRALHQAARLHEFEARSAAESRRLGEPRLMVVKTAEHLRQVVASVGTREPLIGAVLGLEGVHWLGDKGESAALIEAGVDELFRAGFRMLAPTHRFNNALGGANEGCAAAGLHAPGRIVLRKAHDLGMVIDLAHASSSLLAAAIEATKTVPAVSHTGVRASCVNPCNSNRNLTDADIRAIADAGGVIGVGFWPEAVGSGVAKIVEAIAAIVHVLSQPELAARIERRRGSYDPFDHIAFGSDFDGVVETPFDAAGILMLTTALRRYGPDAHGVTFGPHAIAKMTGVNVCRVLALRLPGGGPEVAEQTCSPLIARADPR